MKGRKWYNLYKDLGPFITGTSIYVYTLQDTDLICSFPVA